MTNINQEIKSTGTFYSLNDSHILLNLRKHLPHGYSLKSGKTGGHIIDIICTPNDSISIYISEENPKEATIQNIIKQDQYEQPEEADDEIYKLASLINNNEINLNFINPKR